ncbi:hypothetical protein MalM25_02220 [Planctomycetes bacterium MalM25]|nr:hypothetical protein MalM25_02220 [Planctomycetes bacterium MalM25]
MHACTPRVLLFALLAAVAQPVSAATLSYYFSNPSVPDTPDGYIVNDLHIDFEGQLFGQQMVVELFQGNIYQDAVGGETPPNELLFGAIPTLQSDTFVSMGGANSNTAEAILVVGGSTEFPESTGEKQFNDSGIDIAWAPATGVVIEDQNDFMIARLTLSDDASGRFYFYSNSGGVGLGTHNRWCSFSNGRFFFCPPLGPPVPEPTTGLLALLGGVVLLASRPLRSITLA